MRTTSSATMQDFGRQPKQEVPIMQYVAPFVDKINVFAGIIVALFSYAFGEHWKFFAVFIVLNILDYVTGVMRSWKKHDINSHAGARGAIRKVGYWIVIALGFMVSGVFIEIGEIVNVDLRITSVIGWCALFTMIVNEFRSILENLVEFGIQIPRVLVSGLKAADKLTDNVADKIESLGDGKEEDDAE